MPIVAQILCDNCQTVKKRTNHWYSAALDNNSFCLRPLALAADWAMKRLPDCSIQYFCGRFCAVEALTRWMNTLYDETQYFPTNGKDASIVPFLENNSNEVSAGKVRADRHFKAPEAGPFPEPPQRHSCLYTGDAQSRRHDDPRNSGQI